jgi:leucyl/phenylalanyl-tRNA--protein transferase
MRERAGSDGPGLVAPHIDPIEPTPSRWSMPTDGPIDDSDIVAVGADLEPGTLLAAYRTGLFPMPFDRRRLAWFSPDPRGVLPLDELHVSRSLRKSLRRFDVTMNESFRAVMEGCADPTRPGGWINRAFIDAYGRLHELGWAHSIEVRSTDGELVGGLYGIRIGGFFAGESMFHRATDASKVAVVHTVGWLRETGANLFDVQWKTPHLASLGAIEIPRVEYLDRLERALAPRPHPRIREDDDDRHPQP